MPPTKKKRMKDEDRLFSVRLPPSLVQRLHNRADESGMKLKRLVESLLNTALDGEEARFGS